MSDVGLVYAKQDEEAAEQLRAWLAERGARVVPRVIEGLPTTLVGEEVEPAIRDAERCVVVVSPWLQASDWAFSAEAAAVRDKAMFWTAQPIAPVYGLLATVPQTSALGVLAEHFESPPPHGSEELLDPVRARLSERLEGLHALRAAGFEVGASIEHCADLLRDGPQLLPGEFLGKGQYRLVENVGHGPLASVWKAIRRGTDEPVAVRILHGQFAGDAAVQERFFEMAQAMASVNHAHVATVIDEGGLERGFAYYVRSFFDGGALSDVAALDELGALQAVLDVSRALEYAHQHGVLHQNVKPTNVLFHADGSAVLGDFSVPGAERDAAEALYLAPETQDPRERPGVTADVYALAMTSLYALNGGQLPFWVLRSPEKLIDGLEVSDRVKAALHAALDWDPNQRTGSVAGFVSGLMGDAELVGRLGERAREAGRFDVAAAHLRELLDRGPGRDPALLLSLARTLLAADDVESSEGILLEVLGGQDSEAARDAAELLESVALKTGRWEALASGLRVRALSAEPDADLLVRVARICQEHLGDADAARTSWEDVLEHHTRREQAALALDFLTERARDTEDWPAFLNYGRQVWGFRRDDGELAFALGRACMDALDDPHEALVWLERAMSADYLHDELAVRLEKIRSDRGEWQAVVSLMLERAESLEDEAESVELLVRASRVALHAHNDLEDAAAILLRVLLRNPEHREALRFLARHHARAGRDDRALALYGRLAPHEERSREGESVAIRVADNVDYARLLLRNDRPRGAQLCLEAALDLNPAHLPTLRLVSALSYDLGKWDEARVAYEGLVTAYSSAEPDPVLVNSLVRLGDLAWLEGRLSVAAGHYNRALELQPDHIRGWWGKAKVGIAGLAARGDCSSLDSEPWLLAPPVRITPHEALARLFAGLLHPPAIVAWMKLDAKGPEILQLVKGAPPLVVASAAVDLMDGRSLIHLELFRRLSDAFPSWADAVEAVRRLWFDGDLDVSFPLTDAYRWHGPDADFDSRRPREAMCLEPPLDGAEIAHVRPSLAALHHESAWRKLFRQPRGEPQRPQSPTSASESSLKGQSAVLVIQPRSAEQRVVKVDQTLTLGSAAGDTYRIAGAGSEALKIERVGERFYVFREGTDGARLRGGEAFNLEGTLVEFLLFDADDPPNLGQAVEEEAKPAKAALFYVAEGAERMLPLPSEWTVLRETESGFDAVMTDSDVFDVKLQAVGGRFRAHERPDELEAMGGLGIRERWLEHNDEVVVGAVVLQFRLLNRAMETAPVEDLAALWGAPPGVPLLVYDDGTRHGRPVPLSKSGFAIGRGRDTDFQIAVDASLSRIHCLLDIEDDQVRIRDAGSANGTRVNGMRLSATVNLVDGDLIEIGQSRLEFRTKDGVPGALAQMSLQDFGADDPTEVLPVGEMSKGALGLDEGLDKIRVVNRVLEIALGVLDQHDGAGRGSAELRVVLDVRPKTYQQLLDGVDIAQNSIPGLEVMYNLAQRPETEQRPLLNYVLGDLVERVMERVCDAVPENAVEPMLSEIAETRYREYLRF